MATTLDLNGCGGLRDYYRAQRRREAAHIETAPEAEREEVRTIYARMGFSGSLLHRVVDTSRWLDDSVVQLPGRVRGPRRA
ncbi:MAG: VIT1/CCC1 transporter family protein [Candidatus Dormibacteria bacterium]